MTIDYKTFFPLTHLKMKQNVICIIRIPCLVLMASSDFELEKPTASLQMDSC